MAWFTCFCTRICPSCLHKAFFDHLDHLAQQHGLSPIRMFSKAASSCASCCNWPPRLLNCHRTLARRLVAFHLPLVGRMESSVGSKSGFGVNRLAQFGGRHLDECQARARRRALCDRLGQLRPEFVDMVCQKLSQSPSFCPTSSFSWAGAIMAFLVKKRTKEELLKWARGRGRVMRGYLEMEKPSVEALGETGEHCVGERCQFGKNVNLPAR